MGTVTLTKVLNIREQEKMDAQMAYNQSLKTFEEIATRLYMLLKKKEAAEETYEVSIQDSMQIEKIRQQMDYIEILSRKIVDLERDVQKAREEMNLKHSKLENAHVEVKKFEKIIENRQQTKAEMLRKQEEATMDEISIQQYLSQTK